MSKLRIGIVSFSHLHAYKYADALLKRDDIEWIGLFDEDQQRGDAASVQYGITRIKQLEALLEQVDGVVICSENRLHYQYAMLAAERGIHILLEKPLTTDGIEGRKLIEMCESNNAILQTAFPVRLNTSIEHAKQQVDAGVIGDVIAVSATNRSKMPGGWFVDPERSGGGAILDHTVHVTDVLRWMIGSEVAEVYAEAGTMLHDIPVEDCGLLSMTFENGVVATLDTSWSRPRSFPVWSDVTMKLIGTAGVLHVDIFNQSGDLWMNDEELTHERVYWGDVANEALVSEFIASIQQQRNPCITGEDGLRAAEVAWAAYESIRLGQPVAVTRY
jgi:UDP-N-acetylglucosamine 3-dehydrogenase